VDSHEAIEDCTSERGQCAQARGLAGACSMTALRDLIFGGADSTPRRAATFAVLAGMFAAGVIHWVVFFDFGRIAFTGGDWPKEYLYYSVLQKAVQTATIPFHVDQPVQETNRFLAIPEKVSSPQLVLLRFVQIGPFVTLNVIVMYAVGFWGCLLIRRRYALSLASFALLFLLFHFNGHLTAHLAAGHSMWNGYFLLPFFCYHVLALCDTPAPNEAAGRRRWLMLAMTLFAMNLQGSFHMYVWNVLFLGLVGAFNRTYLRPLALAVTFSGLLSAVLLFPAAITFWNAERMFLTGYPTLGVLLEALVSIKAVDAAFAPALIGEVGWWEYDLFIGTAGLAAMLYLGVWLRWRVPAALRSALDGTNYRQLDWPMGVMVVLSLGALYGAIAMLPIPFLNVEANPSRFLITPFLFLLIISCLRLDRLLSVRGQLLGSGRVALEVLVLVGLVQTAFELATHSKAWAAPNWPRLHSGVNVTSEIGIVQQVDPWYEWIVYASFAISVLSLLVWAYWCMPVVNLPREAVESRETT
jgi:hypothetical protein